MALFIPFNMKAIFILFRIFGQFPLKISENSVTLWNFLRFYNITLVVLYVLTFLYFILWQTPDCSKGLFLSNIFTGCFSLVACVLSVFCGPIFRPQFWKNFYQQLFSIDKELENCGMVLDYRVQFRRGTTVIVLLLSFLSLQTIEEFISPIWVQSIGYLWYLLQTYFFFLFIMLSYLYFTTFTLKHRFRLINDRLTPDFVFKTSENTISKVGISLDFRDFWQAQQIDLLRSAGSSIAIPAPEQSCDDRLKPTIGWRYAKPTNPQMKTRGTNAVAQTFPYTPPTDCPTDTKE